MSPSFRRPPQSEDSSEVSDIGSSDDEVVPIAFYDISDYDSVNILPQTASKVQQIRKWLAPTQYDIAGGEYRKHLDSHAEGTGSWLTSSDAYQQWLQGDQHGFLWVKGIPGSGKSVHAAKIIQSLSEANPDCPVLYFFFRQIIAANHEPQALVRDWMHQLLGYSPPLQQRLAEYVEEGAKLSELSSTTLLEDLKKAFLSLPSRVFCIVDALDEMDVGNEVFLEELVSLGHWRPRTVKVFVTSRPVPRVELSLGKRASLVLKLERDMVDDDISTFARTSLEGSKIPKDKWDTIISVVLGKAKGLFLYARLAMEAFRQPVADISTIVSTLPADLNVLYADLIQAHRRRSGVAESTQLLILQAITHAVRPLRLIELANLIMVLDPDGRTSTLSVAKELVRKACGPLLEILPDETVSVIHHSFTEYLKGVTRPDNDTTYCILREGIVHDRLAQGCLQYLVQSGCLDDDPSRVDGREQRRVASIEQRIKFPFHKYAATNWHIHVRTAEAAGHPQDNCIQLLHTFFKQPNAVKSWLAHNWIWARPPWSDESHDPRDFTSLQVAASCGLVAFTQALLKEPMFNINDCDSRGRTALWWAAKAGHAPTVSVLIDAGADPDLPDNTRDRRPLQMAASANHVSILKVLFAAGVHPLTGKELADPGRRGRNDEASSRDTALGLACRKGHLEAFEFLLPLAPYQEVQEALWLAVEQRHASLVRRIAQHPGVDVNHMFYNGTALHMACKRQDLACVEALLEFGADPQKSRALPDGKSAADDLVENVYFKRVLPGVTPLFELCGAHVFTDDSIVPATVHAILRKLVEAGADIHHRSVDGQTALHSAARSSVVTARMLLDAGASPDVVDSQGCTPLHACLRPEMVSLLVEHGKATVDMATWFGQTALGRTLEGDPGPWPGKAERLLELGADPNLVSGIAPSVAGSGALNVLLDRREYGGALSVIRIGQHVEFEMLTSGVSQNLIKLLLDRGADPNRRTPNGRTPLMSARARGKSIQGLLLKAGADLNARCHKGETLFFKECSMKAHGSFSDHEHLTRLIDLGAMVDVRDNKGRTCLHDVVAWCGHGGPTENGIHRTLDRMDYLIGLGIDPKAVDYAGNSLLHELSRQRSSILMWEYLVYKLKLDVDKANYAGRTPLHTFCEAYEPVHPQMRDMRDMESGSLDFILNHSTNTDMPDSAGVTALHISVAKSEILVRRLLQAGADPLALTHDRMNTLHIAARAQKLNNIGLLLTNLSQKQAAMEHEEDHKEQARPSSNVADSVQEAQHSELPGINVTESAMNQPLFYAVRSGRPEAVRLLLEAGADPSQGPQACPEFEAEKNQELKLKVEDHALRHSYLSSDLEHHTARLEEILEMLIAYGADLTELRHNHEKMRPPPATLNARAHFLPDTRAPLISGYTAFCLTQLLSNTEAERAMKVLDIYGTRLTTVAYWFIPEENSDDFPRIEEGSPNVHLFHQFMRNRQYHLVEELARRGAAFLPEGRLPLQGNLVPLVAHGFTKLVETIGAILAQKALEGGKWHAFDDSTKPGLWYAQRQTDHVVSLIHQHMFPESLLMAAVKRKEPNLAMMKILVKMFRVDPNEASLEVCEDENDDASLSQVTRHETPLHFLARGYCWWHVYQGLPYLLRLPGINVDPKVDSTGLTPLHSAISNDSMIVRGEPGLYKVEAARILLENGADPNAVVTSSWGTYSCLALAKHSAEMTRMLLSHGAVITPESFMAVVRSLEVQTLEALLSTGFNPNTVFTPAGKSSGKDKAMSEAQDQEVALRLSAGDLPRFRSRKKELDKPSQRRAMIRLLLEHGADPFLRFQVDIEPGRIDKYPNQAEARPASPVSNNFREATALHEIIFRSGLRFLPVFLERGVDLNVKDARGFSVFHAACHHEQAINEPWYKLVQADEARVASDKASPHVKQDVTSTEEDYQGSGGETIFEHLLAAGADITTRDNLDRNILMAMLSRWTHITETEKCTRAIRMIAKEAPELINHADMNGETPLMYAARGGKHAKAGSVLKHASQLLEVGALIHCKNKSGDSLLHLLTTFMPADVQAVFRDLVARGLDINGRNDIGETPLFNFARRSSKDDTTHRWNKKSGGMEAGAIEMFKELGADFTTKDNQGRGLLHVAGVMNCERFKELLAEGLDPLEEDKDGQTAIDKAAASNNIAVLKLFQKDKAGKK